VKASIFTTDSANLCALCGSGPADASDSPTSVRTAARLVSGQPSLLGAGRKPVSSAVQALGGAAKRICFAAKSIDFATIPIDSVSIPIDFATKSIAFGTIPIDFAPQQIDFATKSIHFVTIPIDFVTIPIHLATKSIDFASIPIDFVTKEMAGEAEPTGFAARKIDRGECRGICLFGPSARKESIRRFRRLKKRRREEVERSKQKGGSPDAVRCLLPFPHCLFFENLRKSAKSADNWFWLRPTAALDSPWFEPIQPVRFYHRHTVPPSYRLTDFRADSVPVGCGEAAKPCALCVTV